MSWILPGIPLGIALLYLGSEWMVDGARKTAARLGVTPFIVGLTVVALGSSSPELVTSLVSGDNPQIIVGNIVGSNIANVCLAIGLAAVISPIACRFAGIRFEMASMMAAVLVVSALALTGALGYVEGTVLLAALAVFLCLTYKLKRGAPETPDDHPDGEGGDRAPLWRCAALVAAGILFLYVGARAFIGGAVGLAELFGVSDLMIGLIVVAVGVSLPELCICVVAAYRKENEIVVSNIVGSVVFNSFFALGVGVVFTTVPVTHYTMAFHLPVMALSAALLALLVRRGDGVTRRQGAALVCVYSAYIALMCAFPELTQGLV
ncbi:MAG: calcium/sodium antiporter [Methanomassiliicoccaceae archaeon]|nr:calcium/sodium antiporter [Methanomassiliicoccaceae archaeon]